jgi:hypothetical protein
VPTACGGRGLRARCLRLPGLTRCLMVLRATETYVCSGACISTGLCCKDGANKDKPGCPDNTACNGAASSTGAACVCDSDTACCATGDDCPNKLVFPSGSVCTVVATSGGDGVCGCPAGKIFAGGALLIHLTRSAFLFGRIRPVAVFRLCFDLEHSSTHSVFF